MQALVQAGYDRSLLYEEKAITLTEAEKLVDAQTWNSVAATYVIKPPGKPTLVPEDDKRAEWKSKPSATDASGGNNQYKEQA